MFDIYAELKRIINALNENDSVSVVSREGLIKLKTLSGRTQDKADIESLTEIEDES